MANFAVDLQVYEGGRRKPQYTLNSDLNGEVTLQDLLEWTKATLIIVADEVLKDAQAQGFDKEPIVAVDGRVGKPVAAVSPLGQIEFTSRADVMDIVFEAYEGVLYRSKVDTGRYKSSHYVFLNGTQIAGSMRELESWYAFTNPVFKQNDTIRIVNIQPYARKLERYGITAQRSKVRRQDAGGSRKPTGKLISIPNGTYALTARAIRSKYKRNSIIRFAFLPGSSLGITGNFKSGRSGKNSAGRPYLYPSIVISVSERGTI
jgi:hypothetical protein